MNAARTSWAEGCERARRRSISPRPWRRAGIAVPLVLAACLCACERTPTPPPAGSTATQPAALGPRDTLAELIRLRKHQHYQAMRKYVVQERGQALAETLLAVDDFLAANRRLDAWIETHIGLGVAQMVDQSYMTDDLGVYLGGSTGIFSRDVEFLDQVANDGTTDVSFLVAGHLPVQQARLVRAAQEGGWRYDPQTVLPPRLADAFLDMARGLDLLRTELETGQLDTSAMRRNPEAMVDKVQSHLRRGVRLLSEAAAQRASASTTRATSEPSP